MSETSVLWVAAVVVAVVRDGRVLGLRRASHKAAGAGRWESVSGRIEIGEEPARAAERETREETGLEVIVDPRPVDAYVAEHLERPLVVVVFRADVVSDGQPRLSDEHDAAEWLSPAEIGARGSWPRLVLALERALAARSA